MANLLEPQAFDLCDFDDLSPWHEDDTASALSALSCSLEPTPLCPTISSSSASVTSQSSSLPSAIISLEPTPLPNLPVVQSYDQALVTPSPTLVGSYGCAVQAQAQPTQPRRVSSFEDEDEESAQNQFQQQQQQLRRRRSPQPLQQQPPIASNTTTTAGPPQQSLAFHRALSTGGHRVRLHLVRATVHLAPHLLRVRDARGRTPLLMALERNCPPDVVLAILEAAPDAAAASDVRSTLPIHVASRGRYPLEVVRAVARAHPHSAAYGKDFHGWTALDVAVRASGEPTKSSTPSGGAPDHDELVDYLQGLAFEGIEQEMVHL